MDNYTAVGIAEGFEPCTGPEEYVAAWQHLIDTGLAWQLHGWFGRQAKILIGAGECVGTTLREGHSTWHENDLSARI